ncbi:MAG TPA: redoxin domain-containing protein [Tepidisphaeraceae bacterium]|nr:redoxin domain-containing protein [Tepidisphaeraceae bacterium]
MISPRYRAQIGVFAATSVFIVAFMIVVAGAFEQPQERQGLAGSPAASFRLPDLDGNIVSFSSLRGSVMVLCFNPSPTSNSSIDDAKRLAELGQKYSAGNDVKLVQIYTGADATAKDEMSQIQARATDAGNHCTTLLDPTSRISQRYAVQDTPTFFVIDSSGIIRYRGGIDDSSADAPLAATNFTSMIDLLLAEKPLPGQPEPAVLSNIK